MDFCRFGAVLEEFEVRDALSNVLAMKLDTYASFNGSNMVSATAWNQ